MKTKNPGYSEIQRANIASASCVRVYGVPAQEDTHLEGHLTIVWCGFSVDGQELKKCTRRLWHIPSSQVMSSGDLDDFECEGHKVRWFDVHRDATPVEEVYSRVSLADELKHALFPACEPCKKHGSGGVFGGHVGVRPEKGELGQVVVDFPPGVLPKKVQIVHGGIAGELAGLCRFLEASKQGECFETTTNGLATWSLLAGKFMYDNETDTVIVTETPS